MHGVVWIGLLSLGVAACAVAPHEQARTVAPVHSEPARAGSAAATGPSRAPTPCGRDSAPPIGTAAVETFARAHERATHSHSWGGGIPALALPDGFRLATANDRNEGGVLTSLDPEPPADQRAAWLYSADASGLQAAAAIHEHPQPANPSRPFAQELARRFGDVELPAQAPADESLSYYFNVLSEFIDPSGRANVEWAYVVKGCERLEIYERFIALPHSVWHARVMIGGSVDDEQLAEWLARFFDSPLAASAAPQRTNLRGHKTQR